MQSFLNNQNVRLVFYTWPEWKVGHLSMQNWLFSKQPKWTIFIYLKQKKNCKNGYLPNLVLTSDHVSHFSAHFP